MFSPERHWCWYLSALFYRLTYNQIAHQLDDDLFVYLGGRIRGAVVADCGCGPGIVAKKFLERGAARVFAIDVNAVMLYQTRQLLEDAVYKGFIVTVKASFDPQLFLLLREQSPDMKGFDIILFKRSLYIKADQALSILRAAVDHLSPGGVLVVIHPDRSIKRYAFGSGWQVRSHTPYHLFNRLISLFGDKLGIGHYNLYSPPELIQIVQTASPDLRVELIPSKQTAYNLVAAWR